MAEKMKTKPKIKIAVDVVMSTLLLFLMAYQVTGGLYHEIIGAAMLTLFISHNVLNYKWYKSIFKGKYSLARIIRTIVNIALLVMIILTGYSGIVLSKHIFAFLPIESGMALARKLHMCCSYWGFVLMSFHLGMHWNLVANKLFKADKNKPSKQIAVWISRIFVLAVAVYGAYLFGLAKIFSYMFLQTQFVMFDYTKSAVATIYENLAMMILWGFCGCYLMKSLTDKKIKKVYSAVSILLCAMLIFVSTMDFSSKQKNDFGGTNTQNNSFSFNAYKTVENSNIVQ